MVIWREETTELAPPEYRVAADHITTSSSSTDKVQPSNRFEVKDIECHIPDSRPIL
jgi:hypothetical protein